MANEIVLQMKNITKFFGPNPVLKNVDFNLIKGEVHALLGANGAGKSTLVKILSGVLVSYEGEILLNGKKVKPQTPQEAVQMGISIIHQELELVENLTVYENIWLGQELKKSNILINYAEMEKRSQALLDELEFELDAGALVEELSAAQRQLVMIARAIRINPNVMIMDEPTSSLSMTETENLFHAIRRLKQRGISIIYISHYMEEIFEIADRATILRNGEKITEQNIENCTKGKIVEWMIGSKNIVNEQFHRKKPEDEIVLSVDGLDQSHTHGIVKNVSFKVRRGEIVGLAGVVGSGRTEIANIIFGVDTNAHGTITLKGKTYSADRGTPEKAAKTKLGYIPEERKRDGIIGLLSIKKNIAVTAIDGMRRYGIIQTKKLNDVVMNLVERMNIVCTSADQDVASLSGGNQQKVVIGKWLAVDSDVLIMDQPTKGIDIGAKYEIYKLVNDLAERGVSIIYISDELEEIINLADRVYVVKHGTIVAEYDNDGREIEKSTLLHTMIGEAEQAV